MKKWLVLLLHCLVLVRAETQPLIQAYKLSLAIDVPVSANAVALLGASLLVSTTHELPKKESLLLLNRDSVNGFDRGATYERSKAAGYASDAVLYGSVAMPLLQLINKNSRRDFGKVAAISAETLTLNLALTDFVKETAHRTRPLVYNPDVPLDTKYKKDNFKSFYSGHTSTVSAMGFSFAEMYAAYNPDSKLKPMVWTLCAALPVLAGVLRYKAGKHYWTDIITGYVAGAVVGLAVPYLHSTALGINR